MKRSFLGLLLLLPLVAGCAAADLEAFNESTARAFETMRQTGTSDHERRIRALEQRLGGASGSEPLMLHFPGGTATCFPMGAGMWHCD